MFDGRTAASGREEGMLVRERLMTGFDVYVNGRRLCRAGVGPEGVLSAHVTWVRYSGAAAMWAKRRRKRREYTEVAVGGLAENHLGWGRRSLKPGDEITIRVVSAMSFDPPVRVERRDPKIQERSERKYYLKLRRKYEGKKTAAARASSPRRRTRA